jgi:hypothetical protein
VHRRGTEGHSLPRNVPNINQSQYISSTERPKPKQTSEEAYFEFSLVADVEGNGELEGCFGVSVTDM